VLTPVGGCYQERSRLAWCQVGGWAAAVRLPDPSPAALILALTLSLTLVLTLFLTLVLNLVLTLSLTLSLTLTLNPDPKP